MSPVDRDNGYPLLVEVNVEYLFSQSRDDELFGRSFDQQNFSSVEEG
jgi:hypothetical protein